MGSWRILAVPNCPGMVEGSEKEAAVLKSGLSKEEAEAIKEKLAAVGAKIEIE